MAQIDDSSSGSRSANTELNLVPFIDLMSVLITFLLITAVWSQVSMIQLGTSTYSKKTAEQVTPPPPLADIPLRLDVKEMGFRLLIGKDMFQFPRSGEKWDTEGLLARLQKIKEDYPTKTDAVITIDNTMAYEKLILGMDTLLQGGFPSIAITPAEAE
jgi:biopolymer transport protein ExbD